MDGLGALVLSPTRELAVQIFEVLRKIGGHHQFSAGLVIGGKNLKEEKVKPEEDIVCVSRRFETHSIHLLNRSAFKA